VESSPLLKNGLTLKDSFKFHTAIKDLMCEAPYACSTVFQNLAHRTRATYIAKQGYDERGDDVLTNESIDERLISLQICNNEVTDDTIHQFI